MCRARPPRASEPMIELQNRGGSWDSYFWSVPEAESMSAAYIKLPQGRCWVKDDRWLRRDLTCRGYHAMKVFSMKMLPNEAKWFFLISNVGYLICKCSFTVKGELNCRPPTEMTTWLFPDKLLFFHNPEELSRYASLVQDLCDYNLYKVDRFTK